MTGPSSSTDAAYADRLTRLSGQRWKQVLDVQAPYRWHLRSLDLGFTLDVGCGVGRNLAHLDGHGVGVDPNTAAVAEARRRGLEALTPEEFLASEHAVAGRFDSLLVAHVLEHLEPAEAAELLASYLPYLRPGGRVVLITPQEAGQRSDATHVTFLDFDAVAQVAASAGIAIERRRSFPLPRPAGRVFRHNEFVSVGRAIPAPVMDAELTFAVPFYRNAAYLRHTLDSIVAQTEPRWRAMVIDDAGPEPEAAAVVASYDDDRIGYVRNDDNLGLGGNWNRGLDDATTDLVTILHADDELEPSYAEVVLAAHGRHPDAVAVHCRARIIGSGGTGVFSLPDIVKRWGRPYTGGRDLVSRGDSGLASLLRVNVIVCPTLCFRRSRLDQRRFDGRWGMVLDLDLVARLLLDGDTLVGVPDVAFRYRRHPGSETSMMIASAVRFEEELALYDELASRTAARGWPRSARAARTKVMVRTHLLYRAATDVLARRWSAARVKLGLLVGRHGGTGSA